MWNEPYPDVSREARARPPRQVAEAVGYEKLHQIRLKAPHRAFLLGVQELVARTLDNQGWTSSQQIADYMQLRLSSPGGTCSSTVGRIRRGQIDNMAVGKLFEVLEKLGADASELYGAQRPQLVRLHAVAQELWQQRGVRGLEFDKGLLEAVLSLEPELNATERDLTSALAWQSWQQDVLVPVRRFLRAQGWGEGYALDFLVTVGDWKFATQFLPLQLAVRHSVNATCHWRKGNPRKAEVNHRQALQLFAESPAVNNRLECQVAHCQDFAYLLRRTGRPEAAERVYRKGLEIQQQLVAQSPEDPAYRRVLGGIRHGLARLLQERGKLAQAADQLEAAGGDMNLAFQGRLQAPGYRLYLSQNNWVRALILRQSGEPTRAEYYYQEALDLRIGVARECPENPDGHNELAWLLATLPDLQFRDPAKAVEHAERAAELVPSFGNYSNTLGVAYFRADRLPEAVEALENACRLHGAVNPIDWLFLAMAHWRQGDKQQARRCYDRAIQRIKVSRLQDEEVWRFRAEAEDMVTPV